MKDSIIHIFIGYDHRERAATNVLIDSIYQKTSVPVSITPLVTPQLKKNGLYWRERDSKQSTDFSFTRFLVPYLMNYEGWALFMDCDMLFLDDINKLWNLKDDKYALLCVNHKQKTTQKTKFQGEVQTSYPKKNWSSLMLLNCSRCKKLSLDYVNKASGLELHRFLWLNGDDEIGHLNPAWNFLIDEDFSEDKLNKNELKNIHWTLGGPWFKDQRNMGGELASDWFNARNESIKLWD